jgi:hypothetical protein
MYVVSQSMLHSLRIRTTDSVDNLTISYKNHEQIGLKNML